MGRPRKVEAKYNIFPSNEERIYYLDTCKMMKPEEMRKHFEDRESSIKGVDMEKKEMGINEILDVYKPVDETLVGLIKLFHDGAQPEDLMPTINLVVAQIENVREAIKDIDLVPDQFRDLDEAESAQLAGVVLATVFKVLKALK